MASVKVLVQQVLESDAKLKLYNIAVQRLSCKTCTDSICLLFSCIQGYCGKCLHHPLHSILHMPSKTVYPQQVGSLLGRTNSMASSQGSG